MTSERDGRRSGPVLGAALWLVALFMFIGFLNADIDRGAWASLAAIAIASGLPALGGSWLLARHFGLLSRAGQRRERLRRETLEAEILRMAGRNAGRLTAVEVAGELGVPAESAKEMLDALMVRELADIEVTESGVLVYAFHDLRHLDEKHGAKGLLDD